LEKKMDETPESSAAGSNAEPSFVAESKPLNPLQRFIGIFAAPMDTLKNIAARPEWIVPIIILILVSVVGTRVMLPAILADSSGQIDKMIESGKLPPEQAEQAIKTSQGFTRNFAPFMAGLSVPIVALLASAVLLFVGNIIMAGKANFQQMFSLYLWTGMVDLVGLILRIPLALQQNTTKIYFSPAAFLGPDTSETVLFKVFAFLDVFVLWRVVLVTLAFTALYRFALSKSLTVILALYVLLIVVSVSIWQMF
jgi:hypothetical protein